MTKKILNILYICILIIGIDCWNEEKLNAVHYQPEQVHLSFGESLQTFVVTWSTRGNPNASICEYGESKYDTTIKSLYPPYEFIDEGLKRQSQFIHRINLEDLKPNTSYVYRCGSDLGWSEQYSFHVPPLTNDPNWIPALIIYGDMGYRNAVSLPYLEKDIKTGLYDAIIHAGDFAYDMHTNDGQVGDDFMNLIQPLAAQVPYMTCVGNHESHYNFSHYRKRFSMPGGSESLFYSFNMGPVHFIGFSTEVYYFLEYGYLPLVNQYDWLVKDLEEANKPENREKQPWIVTFGHRPMYCSNDNGDDCSKHETVVRVGLPILKAFGLEDVFLKYGVDVEIWAHEHCYERFWPLYNYKVYNGSSEEPYRNPKAPVHLVTGAAGNQEGREPFFKNIPDYSAFHSQDFGFTRMKAYNRSHLHFEQVSVDQNGDVIDSFWIIKDHHGPYEHLLPSDDA